MAISDKKSKKQKEETAVEYINLKWWEEYNDEHLKGYILKALDNNQDLKIATLKVEEARQSVKAQRSAELPSLTVGAAPSVAKLPGSTSSHGYFAIPIIANYEFDLFLKNHDKTKSIKKIYEASKLSEKATYIAVVSAVGSTYFNVVKADKLIDLQEEIVDNRSKIYELMKQRNEVGITSTSDLVKAEKAYILADSDLTELEKMRENLLTTLAVLIGESPQNISQLKRMKYDEINFEKAIPESVSSDVIFSRPDYLAVEKMVEKAGIDVRVAKKEFLPTINLTGLMALTSDTLGNSMSWSNAIAGVGAGALLPLFTGGRKMASLRIYKNKYEQVLQEYQKTNLTAIKEVNDSLSDLKYDDMRYKKNFNALNMETKDFKYAQDKYNQGILSHLDLIQKQEVLLSTEKMVVASKLDKCISNISLYKATAAADL